MITLPSFLPSCSFRRTKTNYRRRDSRATAWRLFGDYLSVFWANESKNASLKNAQKWLNQAVYCTLANNGKSYLAFLVRTTSLACLGKSEPQKIAQPSRFPHLRLGWFLCDNPDFAYRLPAGFYTLFLRSLWLNLTEQYGRSACRAWYIQWLPNTSF